jgi:hypothetical protein
VLDGGSHPFRTCALALVLATPPLHLTLQRRSASRRGRNSSLSSSARARYSSCCDRPSVTTELPPGLSTDHQPYTRANCAEPRSSSNSRRTPPRRVCCGRPLRQCSRVNGIPPHPASVHAWGFACSASCG